MARIEADYQVDVEATDKQGGGGLLPHMYARVQAEAITLTKTKDGQGWQADITFEVVEPEEFSRKKFWEYWTIVHPDEFKHGQYKYGKPRFDRLVRAVGVDPEEFSRDPETDNLLFKSFAVEIGIEIGGPNTKDGGFYKDKNRIERFYYEDDGATEAVPELGVIGDGTQGKKKNDPASAPPVAANNNRPAANQNRPAAAAAPAKAAGSKPWGKK